MPARVSIKPRQYAAITRKDLGRLRQLRRLSGDQIATMKAVAAVLPFRVNRYVVEQLIDWDNVPDDPIYQLTFPQPGMLEASDLTHMLSLVRRNADRREIRAAAREIQLRLNPHPAGQLELNVPPFAAEASAGIQHKYRETVLLFPSPGQTCHAYCSYCFRWAQFVGIDSLKFAAREVAALLRYLERHPDVTSVLITGGDPMVMRAPVLERYVEPLLAVPQLTSIRIGTKATAYWPYRFVTDPDADDVLRVFERVVESGKHLALMAHYSHPRELGTDVAEVALRRIQATGAVVRSQAPVIRHVNDNPDVWAEMWSRQVRLGVVPYYMFVERDTGAKRYFELPLARTLEIYQGATRRLSGLGRTARGPVMSANPGKVLVNGIVEIAGRKLFALSFLQARNPTWSGRPFFAEFDSTATWMSELIPAFGEPRFFFEAGMHRLRSRRAGDALGSRELQLLSRSSLTADARRPEANRPDDEEDLTA